MDGMGKQMVAVQRLPGKSKYHVGALSSRHTLQPENPVSTVVHRAEKAQQVEESNMFDSLLPGGFKHFLFIPLPGEMMQSY